MSRKVMPLPQVLAEIRRVLYPHFKSEQYGRLFRIALGRDIGGVHEKTVNAWLRGESYPQAEHLRKLKELARRAGVEIAGSPASHPAVTLAITAAIDTMSARLPMSHAEMARRCGVRTSTLSHWRGKGILPREEIVRDKLRRLAAEARVTIEGL